MLCFIRYIYIEAHLSSETDWKYEKTLIGTYLIAPEPLKSREAPGTIVFITIPANISIFVLLSGVTVPCPGNQFSVIVVVIANLKITRPTTRTVSKPFAPFAPRV